MSQEHKAHKRGRKLLLESLVLLIQRESVVTIATVPLFDIIKLEGDYLICVAGDWLRGEFQIDWNILSSKLLQQEVCEITGCIYSHNAKCSTADITLHTSSLHSDHVTCIAGTRMQQFICSVK